MYENLLPIGSVVLLTGGNKRLMITNRITTPGEPREVFDYAGCPYPEGLADASSFYFFNHDFIERVYFIGFQDEEELIYRERVLAPIGELYVNDEGQIVERTPQDGPASESSEVGGKAELPEESDPATEELVEAPDFAEVEA